MRLPPDVEPEVVDLSGVELTYTLRFFARDGIAWQEVLFAGSAGRRVLVPVGIIVGGTEPRPLTSN